MRVFAVLFKKVMSSRLFLSLVVSMVSVTAFLSDQTKILIKTLRVLEMRDSSTFTYLQELGHDWCSNEVILYDNIIAFACTCLSFSITAHLFVFTESGATAVGSESFTPGLYAIIAFPCSHYLLSPSRALATERFSS